MFRKLVSNLAFSPALVGQLGFYAKRLRKEEATRRAGLIFTALALVVQSFAVFQPPESANASSPNDFIAGGVTTLNQYLSAYDRNVNNLRDIYSSLGITRSEIAATKAATITSKSGAYSWGHQSRFSAAQGEGTWQYKTASGANDTVHYRPLSLWQGTRPQPITYAVYQGYSQQFGGWFAIMLDCGNLATKKPPTLPPPPKPAPTPIASCSMLNVIVTDRTNVQLTGQATSSGGAAIKAYNFSIKNASGTSVYTKRVASSANSVGVDGFRLTNKGSYTASLAVETSLGSKTAPGCAKAFTIAPPAVCQLNPSLPANSPDCQPCPGTPSLWIKDKTCEAKVIKTKLANNLTQSNEEAEKSIAQAADKISYKLTVKNIGTETTTAVLSDKIDDVLEYATLTDAGSGTYDKDAKTISWPEVTLKPGEEQSRVYVVQLAQTIPAMPQGASDKDSYNCVMTNTFGNTVNVDVDCPQVKQVEQVVDQLPQTGVTENLIFAGIVLSIVSYFYARSRQVKKEVRLIRRDLNAGTI